MPVNDTTTNQGYQKPNIANQLSDDVGRLRSALDSIDTDMAARLAKAGGVMTGELGVTAGTAAAPSVYFTGDTNTGLYSPGADQVAISTGGTGRLFVASNGTVGIGQASDTANYRLNIYNPSADFCAVSIGNNVSGSGASNGLVIAENQGNALFINRENGYMAFSTNNTERARIDSSGRLLVGTSTSTNNIRLAQNLAVVGAGTNIYPGMAITAYPGSAGQYAPIIDLNRSRGSTDGSMTSVAADDLLGRIHFRGSDGSSFVNAAFIDASVDGTPGANDMPGRLVFSTTADGASNPTERLRITSAGVLQIADAGNIAVGTTTGTKIGTATTQKLGFFNKTPVVQPTAVADATDAASVITQLNALLSRMRDLGLIAN